MVGGSKNRAQSKLKPCRAVIKFPTGRITRKVKDEISKFILAVANDEELSKLLTNLGSVQSNYKKELLNEKSVSASAAPANAVVPASPDVNGKSATKFIKTKPKKTAKKTNNKKICKRLVGENLLTSLAHPNSGLPLDLAFAMDCTQSMGSYIQSATENIRSIVNEIVKNENSDIRLALVEYRDHRPQEHTFVTRVQDFTTDVTFMETWLKQCRASGGGDEPEAVADALYDVLHLSWRPEATKICVLISDAPPHGLGRPYDSFPNGCPDGHDPVVLVRQMAEKRITLYAVGVEPLINPYRDFFMALAYITGGQYVPLTNAQLLGQVIVGGVREEISLEHLMLDAKQDIAHEMQLAEAEGVVHEGEKASRMNRIFVARGDHVHQLNNAAGVMSELATEYYAKCVNMSEMRNQFLAPTPLPVIPMPDVTVATDVDMDHCRLLECETVSVEQTKRIVQKLKRRKN